MAKKTIVSVKKTRVKDSASDYWTYAFSHNKINDDGECQEYTEANPDNLAESDSAFKQRSPRELKAMQLLEEAVEKLTHKQKKAYTAYYRDGKSETEIAISMDIDQSNVARLLQRALAYVTEYCRMREEELDDQD